MMDYPTSSPAPDEIEQQSINKKEIEKNIYKNNNNNIKEYIKEMEEKNVVRGRKTFAFWVLVGLLFTLAIGNLILTVTILGILRLGQGMQSMETFNQENISNFYGNVDFDNLYNRDGIFKGFTGESVDVSAQDGSVLLNLVKSGKPPINILRMQRNYTYFKGMEGFGIKNIEGTPILMSADTVFKNLKKSNSLQTKQIETSQIKSAIEDDLKIESENVNLKGTEGIKFDGREIVWSADEDIYLKSVNGSIILSGKDGIFVNVNKIPVAKIKNNNITTAQYKVCVCMPEGRLFRIPIVNVNDAVFCDDVEDTSPDNPCLKE